MKLVSTLLICAVPLIAGCGKSFNSVDDCFDYVRNNGATTEKLRVGAIACRWSFNESESKEDRAKAKAARCIVSDYARISNDASGTEVVSRCAESNHAAAFGRALAEYFSASARMEKELREHREELEQAQRERHDALDGLRLHSIAPPPPALLTLDIDGDLKTCSRIGDTLSCF